jgi:hypothetical protein
MSQKCHKRKCALAPRYSGAHSLSRGSGGARLMKVAARMVASKMGNDLFDKLLRIGGRLIRVHD